MPSPYDILGVLFGVISLLGGLKYLYTFLKSQQPPARAAELVIALNEAKNLLNEVERHASSRSEFTSNINLEEYRRDLDRLEQRSLSTRCAATAHPPESVLAVFYYAFRNGIQCELALEIRNWIEDVRRVYAVLGNEVLASHAVPSDPQSHGHCAATEVLELHDSHTNMMPTGTLRRRQTFLAPRRRKALLIGIREIKNVFASFKSPGDAHRDTKRFRHLLLETYNYQSEDIVTLTDNPEMPDEDRVHLWPTRDNIIREMESLVHDARAGDILVLLFSGHGGRIKALNNPDSMDGLDSILFAADSYCQPSNSDIPFANYINGDEIKQTFTTLCAGCRCVMIFDCSHCSETVAGLSNVTENDIPHAPKASAVSKVSGFAKMQTIHSTSAAASTGLSENSFELDGSDVPELSSWSACKDDQSPIGNSKGILPGTPEEPEADTCDAATEFAEGD